MSDKTSPSANRQMADDEYPEFIEFAIARSREAEQRLPLTFASLPRRITLASEALTAWCQQHPDVVMEKFLVSAFISAFVNQRDPYAQEAQP